MRREPQKDIYSSFHIFHQLLKCSGVVPLSFDPNSRKYTMQPKFRLLGGVILFTIVSLQTFFFSHCGKMYTYDYLGVSFLINLDYTFIFAILLIHLNLQSHRIIKLFSRIDTFDQNVNFEYPRNHSLKKHFLLNFIHIGLYILMGAIYRAYASHTVSNFCLLSIYTPSACVLFTRLIFIFFIEEIKTRYVHLGRVVDPKRAISKLTELEGICRKVNAIYHFPLIRNFFRIFFGRHWIWFMWFYWRIVPRGEFFWWFRVAAGWYWISGK